MQRGYSDAPDELMSDIILQSPMPSKGQKEQSEREKGMVSNEENKTSSVTKESATFTTKRKCFGEGAGANSAAP